MRSTAHSPMSVARRVSASVGEGVWVCGVTAG